MDALHYLPTREAATIGRSSKNSSIGKKLTKRSNGERDSHLQCALAIVVVVLALERIAAVR